MFNTGRLFTALQSALPQHLISQAAGSLAMSRQKLIKNTFISLFLKAYDVDLSEAEQEQAEEYPSFNAFFTRALKADARPMPDDLNVLVSPADGCISEHGIIDGQRLLQAKNRDYRLDELLPVPPELWRPYMQGHFTTIYLAPKDYHRFHMPVTARLRSTVYVPGQLYSVNNTTADSMQRLFARNERLVAFFDTPYGPICMVMVGAMIVSGIKAYHHGLYRSKFNELVWDEAPADAQGAALAFERGEVFGHFQLGSTVIVLTPPGMVTYQALKAGDVVRCRAGLGLINV